MGVSCSKSTKAKVNRDNALLLRAEVSIKGPTYSLSYVSDSIFYNVLIRKSGLSREKPEEMEYYRGVELLLLDNGGVSLPGVQRINLANLHPSLHKDFKILYDFKTLIVIQQKEKPTLGDKQFTEFVDFLLKAGVAFKKIQLLSSPLENFLESFGIYFDGNENKIYSPSILFDFQDLPPESRKSKTKFFIEADQEFDEKSLGFCFKKLGIKCIFTVNNKKEGQKAAEKRPAIEYLGLENSETLKKNKMEIKKKVQMGENLLFLYTNEKYKETLDFVVDFLCKQLKTGPETIINYLESLFPHKKQQAIIRPKTPLLPEIQSSQLLRKKSSKSNNNSSLSRCEEMTHLLLEIKKPVPEIEGTIELLQKLLINIINDSENEKFRNIKSSNEKLKKTVFAGSAIGKITEICGFLKLKDSPDIHRNALDIANLKIIKSDLDLALRNFRSQRN